jgi:radical SAM protein with 4Fe4S-binding SPASM domain
VEGDVSKLIDVWLYTTRSCNLSCTYCFEKHEPAFLDLDNARRTVEWAFSQAALAGAAGVRFNFFGGEPLLGMKAFRESVLFAQQVAEARSALLEFRMNTNGTLISDEVAHFLAENHVTIDLSLDGDQASNDLFRKSKNLLSVYKQIGGIERVGALKKMGIDIGINMVVGPDTVRQMSRNVRMCWEHGIYNVQVLPMFDRGREWSDPDLAALDIGLREIAGGIVEGVLTDGRTELLNFSPFAKVITAIMASEDPEDAKRVEQTTWCGIGRTNFSVDVNGNIYSCPRFIHDDGIDRTDSSLVVGNVKELKYKLEVVDHYKSWNPRLEPTSVCYTCEHRLTCIYQCVAHNKGIYKDEYHVHPSICKITPIIHRYAAQLRELFWPPLAARAGAQLGVLTTGPDQDASEPRAEYTA